MELPDIHYGTAGNKAEIVRDDSEDDDEELEETPPLAAAVLGFDPKELFDTDYAEDSEHWITLENGEHVLIDGEGKVVGGAGGNLNGKKLDVKSKSPDVQKTPRTVIKATSAPEFYEGGYEKAANNVIASLSQGQSKAEGRRIYQRVFNGKHNDLVAAEHDKLKAVAPEKKREIKRISPLGYPTSGTISESDPSIYGSELLGHEGESWEKFNSALERRKRGE